jgi:hypothetical protein
MQHTHIYIRNKVTGQLSFYPLYSKSTEGTKPVLLAGKLFYTSATPPILPPAYHNNIIKFR